jgi:hypothetical protein
VSGLARKMARAKLRAARGARKPSAPDLQYREPPRAKEVLDAGWYERMMGRVINDRGETANDVRERMHPHARYDLGDAQAEGRRGWMSHPAGEPNREDKGKRDGSCNRTACQDNLAGFERWSMRNFSYDEGVNRLFYCRTCAYDFNQSDKQFGEPLRCSIYPGDELDAPPPA